ncbi:type II toxin-antitoxin system HicB family antitoxin, partial [bacterium]|nr:type II toxin-antitoxin system HicB family antitoxin [bacterium]
TQAENITIQRGLMKEYKYTVFFEPAEEGGYIVHVPALPEICTEGDTLAEARAKAEDAIRLVIESNIERGEAIPEDVIIAGEPVKEQVAIKFAA